MSLDVLRSRLASLAQMAAAGFLTVRLGLVSSYDGRAGQYLVKVRLQPDDIETGWLPIQTMLPGQGWGIYAGPAIGDQALILFAEGDINAGVCAGFLGSNEDPPPAVESGEIHVLHKDGAKLKFLPDGEVDLIAPGGFFVTADTTITGKLHVTDDVTLDAALTVHGNAAFTGSSVTHGGVNIGKTHVHTETGSVTAVPH